MKKAGRCIVVFLLTFSAVSFLSCTSNTETYTSEEGTVSVDREGEKADITFTSKEGETYTMKVSQGKLPKDWPTELPVIEGGEIVFSQTTKEAEKGIQQVHIETDAPVSEALKFYDRKLKAGGWAVEGTINTPQLNMITASKDEQRAMIQIMTQEKRTRVSIVLNKEG